MWRILTLFSGVALLAAVSPSRAEAQDSYTITCASSNGKYTTCPMPRPGTVRLARVESEAACSEGSSWGTNENEIWVSNGCRAQFRITPWQGGQGGGQGSSYTLTCSSRDDRRTVCQMPRPGTVTLGRVESEAACQENYSWGYNDREIWVSRGCRAQFRITPNASAGGNRPSGGRPDARGPMPCSLDTPVYDNTCQWTVTRHGNGRATINISWPWNRPGRILEYRQGNFTSPGARVQAARDRNGDWVVKVNGEEYYRFADAVITGG